MKTRPLSIKRPAPQPVAEVADELNPAYLFSTRATALLVAIARGELNAQALALDELANRGLDPNTGKWVGFATAKAAAEAIKDQAGIL